MHFSPKMTHELGKCNGIMRKMKKAIAKQKNVSMDVKNCLKEAIYVIIFSRTCWKKPEKEMQKNVSEKTFAGIKKQVISSSINLQEDGEKGRIPANSTMTATKE